jgi:RNA polymerase sigma-70 factor (ECF subfamily)
MHQLDADEERSKVEVSLYDRYAPTILAYLCQHVSSRQDAEDLLAEVFLAAYRNNALADLLDEQQLAWLRRVARNKLIDCYRHTSVLSELPLEQALETEDTDLTPEQRAVKQEQYQRLYAALAQLSPEQRELIQLRYGNEMRLVEIAGMMGRPDGTIRKLLSRTLRQLRAVYEREEKGTDDESIR